MAYFEIMSRHLRGGTERINKDPQSVYSVSEMRFETSTFGAKNEVYHVLKYHAMMMYRAVVVKLRVF